MAYLDDDFQSYSIGQGLPFGSWTGSALFAQIVAGGPSGTTKCFQIQLGAATYDRGASYLSAVTEFVAINKPNGGVILNFVNGPNGLGQLFTLLEIRIENDSTVTALCPTSGEILANSGDTLCRFGTWNFFQVNATFSDAINGGTGILSVRIHCEIALNGVALFNVTLTTTAAVAQLANGTAEVNKFGLTTNTCLYDAYTLDTVQPIVSYPHPGTPSGVVHQGVIELPLEPDTSNIQVMQGAIELCQLPDSANVVDFQGVIELIMTRGKTYISES